jgi:molybdopterin molybdotransferase
MLSVADAQRLILEHCRPLPAERMPLSTAALGRVLAEDVAADLDMPPFDKALMDGYAVRSADLAGNQTVLAVVDEITAGQVPLRPVGPGQCSRIMTGAPMPAGADAVIPVERSRLLDGRVQLEGLARPGDNVLERGREMRQGEVILRAGCVLRPQELGMLATLGRTAVGAVPAPRVAVLATGDELIEPGLTPGPGQIRNSNAAMLVAQAARAGAVPRSLGIARDRLDSLRPLVQQGLDTADVVVLSGGVSAGKLDLVPGVLQDLDVTPHFHKVHLKPGKPVFFGSRKRVGSAEASPSLVFGLPGNPVSSLVCFELFLRPALLRLVGRRDDPARVRARLMIDFPYSTDRPTYHPARLMADEQGWRAQPVPWFGSADLRAFLDADALLVLPPGDHVHPAGQTFDVLRLDG